MRRIGLDLALRAPHRAAICDDGTLVGTCFPVPATIEGIDELLRRAAVGADAPFEITMEPTGLVWLPLAAELNRRGHRTYVVKPQKVHALREFLSEHAKTDGTDARAAALLPHVDPQGVVELRIPTDEQTSLLFFVRQRARLVAASSKEKQRIHALLGLAHPHLDAALADSLFTKPARVLLRKHLDPFPVVERGRAALRRFWSQRIRGSLDEEQFEKIWSAYAMTCAMYGQLRAEDRLPFDYAAIRCLIDQHLDALEFFEKQVSGLESRIRALYRACDPQQTLLQVPGVGETIAAAFEAIIGDISRFPNVKSFAAYTGLIPRTNLTGGVAKPGQRMTKAGQKLLKQYFFLAADTARLRDPELAAKYNHAVARGAHHYKAVVVVAHKLARRVYALLRQRSAARAGVAADPRYLLRRLDDGAELTKAEAHEYVREHYPSKAQRALREKAVRSAPVDSGSSEDAAIRAAPHRRPES